MNNARDEAGHDRGPPEPPVGPAIVRFERGELKAELFQRERGLDHGSAPEFPLQGEVPRLEVLALRVGLLPVGVVHAAQNV